MKKDTYKIINTKTLITGIKRGYALKLRKRLRKKKHPTLRIEKE